MGTFTQPKPRTAAQNGAECPAQDIACRQVGSPLETVVQDEGIGCIAYIALGRPQASDPEVMFETLEHYPRSMIGFQG